MTFLSRNVREIESDPALTLFGGALAVVQLLTFAYWASLPPLVDSLAGLREPLCWPFFESCEAYRFSDVGGVQAYLGALMAVSVACAGLFFARKRIALAYGVLLALNLIKVATICADYRLRQNEHYMAVWTAFAFLLLPSKRTTLRMLMMWFYLWASTLKFNREWLSGAAIYRPLYLVPPAFYSLGCYYVIVLEAVFSWGLLARNRILFLGSLAQFLFFHVVSWGTVGFFYPLLMFCLLSLYPLFRVFPARDRADPSLPEILRGRAPISAYGVWLAFAALQLPQHLLSGVPAITGEGRLYALHMFDGRVACQAYGELENGDPVPLEGLSEVVRIRCDPVVVWNRAKNFCRRASDPKMRLRLYSRLSTDAELKPVIDLQDFCSSPPTYRIWGANDWILKM